MTQQPTPGVEDLIQDGWTMATHNLHNKFRAERWSAVQQTGGKAAAMKKIDELMEVADFEQMERIRSRADALVHDPATAEALKPYCKALCRLFDPEPASPACFVVHVMTVGTVMICRHQAPSAPPVQRWLTRWCIRPVSLAPP